jgi:hypothetical protein
MDEEDRPPGPRTVVGWIDRLVVLVAAAMVLFCLVVLASTGLPGWPLVSPVAFRGAIVPTMELLFLWMVLSSLVDAGARAGWDWRRVFTRRPARESLGQLGRAVRRVLAAPGRHLGAIALAVLVAVLLGIGAPNANKAKGLAGGGASGTFTRYEPSLDQIVPISAGRYLGLQRQGQRGDAALFALALLVVGASAGQRARSAGAAGGAGAEPATS